MSLLQFKEFNREFKFEISHFAFSLSNSTLQGTKYIFHVVKVTRITRSAIETSYLAGSLVRPRITRGSESSIRSRKILEYFQVENKRSVARDRGHVGTLAHARGCGDHERRGNARSPTAHEFPVHLSLWITSEPHCLTSYVLRCLKNLHALRRPIDPVLLSPFK